MGWGAQMKSKITTFNHKFPLAIRCVSIYKQPRRSLCIQPKRYYLSVYLVSDFCLCSRLAHAVIVRLYPCIVPNTPPCLNFSKVHGSQTDPPCLFLPVFPVILIQQRYIFVAQLFSIIHHKMILCVYFFSLSIVQCMASTQDRHCQYFVWIFQYSF